MSKQQKHFSLTPVVAGLLAFSTATLSLEAQAGLQFLRDIKGPVTVSGDGATATYSFSVQMRIVNDEEIPATGTPPAPLAVQITDAIKASFPAAIQSSVSVTGLQIVAENVQDDNSTKKPKEYFNTVTDLTLNTGFKGVATGTDKGDQIFAAGQKLGPYSVVTVRYDVSFKPGSEKGPFVSTASATLGGDSKDDNAAFVLPADAAVRQSVCPEGTVPSNKINLVVNGDFKTGQGKDSKGEPIAVNAGGQIANSFKSDYKYVGDDSYPDYNQITISTGGKVTINKLSHFQYPFPGAKADTAKKVPAVPATDGYLMGAGPKPTLTADSAIWMQSVTGLDTKATYQFEAWLSNPAPVKEVIGSAGVDPKIVLVADADKSTAVTLSEESKNDSWTQIAMAVKPAKTSMALEIRNERVLDSTKGENYDLFAMTGIALRKCVDPKDVDKEDASTSGGGTNPGAGSGGSTSGGSGQNGGSGSGGGAAGNDAGSTTTDGGSSSTSSGGGGGALGAALAGLGLIGLRRRRMR